ncbi:hypothetical protein NDN08_002546 [Rhodosorus marinus]|uniref:Uncharacterized protein n=1 Tax=Rhodosorus marinus TaxID=101924 RepID=A0AAV8UWT3_9RHOD|nr:hypothetical protein NDN08_002546 [Rhodosorus marinus]
MKKCTESGSTFGEPQYTVLDFSLHELAQVASRSTNLAERADESIAAYMNLEADRMYPTSYRHSKPVPDYLHAYTYRAVVYVQNGSWPDQY